MQISVIKKNDIEIAVIASEEILIKDVQSALDLFATVDYETGCSRMIINKSSICEEFFDLSTKIAGEVLQKFINYRKTIAIVGDFTKYKSKSLQDFIRPLRFPTELIQAKERHCCSIPHITTLNWRI